jgi:hypothetical protein
MTTANRGIVAIYVEPARRCWIVRDPEGNLWALDSSDEGWGRRERYELTEGSELIAVPSHYRNMLQLPF